ncbi:aminodeoxychorismate synthase, component I [Shewanella sp. OPT22]|nr:aminodeoxychorismate synthase, component I [Shewanella sp. OPT22]
MVTRKSKCLSVRQIDITLTTEAVFSHFADKPWAVLLDSANANHPDARYDIISFDPVATLVTQNQHSHFEVLNPQVCCDLQNKTTTSNPFDVLNKYQQAIFSDKLECSLPFSGGVLGSFNYDLGRRVEKLPELAENDLSLNEMNIGFYDWALVYDYHNQTWSLVCYSDDESYIDAKQALIYETLSGSRKVQQEFKLSGKWQAQITKTEYANKFNKVHSYLLSGDCYQINLTQRFSANYSGNEWQAYLKLRHQNQAPFSAYIRLPQHTILSISPERFLQLDNGKVETKPIKGTLPRSSDSVEDQRAAVQLQNSVKDRAENLMITDLLRNDLGRVAKAGTVKVPNLFDIESFPAVHHLVSTITADLKDGLSATDLLNATFPGGSITGAPKIRAMEIIEELEPSRRSIYCGSIGYISQDGKMDTSITIRTLVTENNKIYCWAGGGIVADSNIDAEYQETYDKVSKILPILES